VEQRLLENVHGFAAEQLVGAAWQLSSVSKQSRPAELGDAPRGSSCSHTQVAPLEAAGPEAHRNAFDVHLACSPLEEHRLGADSQASWEVKQDKPVVVDNSPSWKLAPQLYAPKAPATVSAPEKHSFGV